MNDTYKHLKSDSDLEYLEICQQSIDYIGKIDIPKELTFYDDEAQINQKNEKGEYFTPFKAVELGEESWKILNNSKLTLLNGELPEVKEYSSKDVIPILIGFKYKDIFNVGDVIKAYYLGNKLMNYKVVGVLTDETVLNVGSENFDLDECIIAPTISYAKDDDEEFKKILMSVKCEGYVFYESKEDFDEKIQKLKEISSETGFKFDIPKTQIECNPIIQLGSGYSLLLLFISFLILVVSIANCKLLKTSNIHGKMRDNLFVKVFPLETLISVTFGYVIVRIAFSDYITLLETSERSYFYIAIIGAVIQFTCNLKKKENL